MMMRKVNVIHLPSNTLVLRAIIFVLFIFFVKVIFLHDIFLVHFIIKLIKNRTSFLCFVHYSIGIRDVDIKKFRAC